MPRGLMILYARATPNIWVWWRQVHCCAVCAAPLVCSAWHIRASEQYPPSATATADVFPAAAVFYIIYCLPAGSYKEKRDTYLPGRKGDVAAKDAVLMPASKSGEVELHQHAPSGAPVSQL
jgi:hypothetical protein